MRTHAAWPVNPSLITLRVCADLDWHVFIHCPKCGIGSQLFGKKLGEGKLADVPVERLFRQGSFKCRKVQYGCAGSPASSVEVTCMDVGMSKTVAKWSKEDPGGRIAPSVAHFDPTDGGGHA